MHIGKPDAQTRGLKAIETRKGKAAQSNCHGFRFQNFYNFQPRSSKDF